MYAAAAASWVGAEAAVPSVRGALAVLAVLLEKASPADVDKAVLVQTGMTKKKLFGDKWPKDRFMALVKQF